VSFRCSNEENGFIKLLGSFSEGIAPLLPQYWRDSERSGLEIDGVLLKVYSILMRSFRDRNCESGPNAGFYSLLPYLAGIYESPCTKYFTLDVLENGVSWGIAIFDHFLALTVLQPLISANI
jgi:hypothetical protein